MEIKRFPLVYERDAMWQLWHGSWMRKDYEGMPSVDCYRRNREEPQRDGVGLMIWTA